MQIIQRFAGAPTPVRRCTFFAASGISWPFHVTRVAYQFAASRRDRAPMGDARSATRACGAIGTFQWGAESLPASRAASRPPGAWRSFGRSRRDGSFRQSRRDGSFRQSRRDGSFRQSRRDGSFRQAAAMDCSDKPPRWIVPTKPPRWIVPTKPPRCRREHSGGIAARDCRKLHTAHAPTIDACARSPAPMLSTTADIGVIGPEGFLEDGLPITAPKTTTAHSLE